MGSIASFLIRQNGKKAAGRFEAATKDPVGTQHRKLMEIVERNKDTEYGRENGFSSIKSLDDYQQQVPVIDYEDIRERIDRMTRGEKNILTAETPVMFNQTSGTTGSAKYIPVTPTCRGRDHSDQMATWMYHASSKHPGMFKGKVVSLVSPAVEGRTESGIPYGSTSGVIYRDLPRVIRSTYATPYEAFLIHDYETKYYVVMRLGLAANVTFVGTANPSSIIKMCEIADQFGDDILQDIADGTLKNDLEIAPEIRSVLEGGLRRQPKRAQKLEEARKRRDGRLIPADYWPNLALIGCWKGGTVGSYLEKFPMWFDPELQGMVPTRDWGYLSSEARCSIPISDHGSAGVLTVAANVFEFVAVDELEASPDASNEWTFLGMEDLEVAKEYYIFPTTTGGLYRYDINDVIEVVGQYNQTPAIIFKRKGRGMTNITGEKLSVNQVIDAFAAASRELGLEVEHYKAEPDFDNARYVFKVEAPTLDAARRVELVRFLDRKITELNIEWEAKRKSLRLGAPVLHVMKPGWYDRHKQALIAGGKRLFQAKTVLLDAKQQFDDEPEETEAVVAMEE